jgi:hypothetical protein
MAQTSALAALSNKNITSYTISIIRNLRLSKGVKEVIIM